MKRVLGVSAVALALLFGGAGARAQQIVGTGVQTFSPALAVSSGGKMLAAWFAGPGPCIYAGACDTNWTGSEVAVAAGTTRSGFGRPMVVSRDGGDEDGGVQVAESRGGVGYVAWEEPQGTRAEIVTVRRGLASPVKKFLPRDVNQIELLSSADGQVGAVWSQYGHGDPVIRYGLLDRTGRISRVVTILRTSPSTGGDVAYSLGVRGQLAAAWTAGRATRMTTCDPSHGCAAAQTVVVGAALGVAVALSKDGTVTVAAAAGPGGVGVFAATEHFGGHLSKAVGLGAGAEWPTAVAVGSSGALLMFEPGPVPYSRLAWSMLGPGGFSSPVLVRDPDTLYTASLAGNADGQFAAAWIDSVRPSGPDSVRIALGDERGFGRPRTVVPGNDSVNGTPSINLGIDGAGNAVVLWNRWCSGPCGMFADVVRR
jgi:hypothetical protein